MQKIILDTNFLLIPGTFKIDIFKEIDRVVENKYQLYIIDKTIDELNKIIENQKLKFKQAAKIGSELIYLKKIKIIKINNKKTVDENIIELAKKEPIIVATQDKELKRALKRLKRPVITLKNKSHLIIQNI